MMKPITPHLWFDKEATEAAQFYCSVFPNSKITSVRTVRDTRQAIAMSSLQAECTAIHGHQRRTTLQVQRVDLFHGVVRDRGGDRRLLGEAFRCSGRGAVRVFSQPKHLSFFTASPKLAEAMKGEINKTHEVSGATIHFSPAQPLPSGLVKNIIR
jgi:hypothetical protein